jgi:hypothetical protein
MKLPQDQKFDHVAWLESLRRSGGNGVASPDERSALLRRAEASVRELPEWVRRKYSYDDCIRFAFAIQLMKLYERSEMVMLADGSKARVFLSGSVSRLEEEAHRH